MTIKALVSYATLMFLALMVAAISLGGMRINQIRLSK